MEVDIMMTWKVWFKMGSAEFALEMRAFTITHVQETAIVIANRLGATFDYEMEEVA